MKRRTKIVCTLGPATGTREAIAGLIAGGMNVARLNCSHGDWESKREWVRVIRELSPNVGPVAILADLQGPKNRIGLIPGGSVTVAMGQSLQLQRHGEGILVPDEGMWRAMAPGDRILFGDGEVCAKVSAISEDRIEAKALSGGTIKSRQGITLVGKSFDVPALTEKDLADVREACEVGVDFIALSYVRRAQDLHQLREFVQVLDPSVKLCAKIETKEALRDLNAIVEASDVLMVARGDLGLQMELQEVPVAQKRIILACNRAGKPVITATQMLESMLANARPTRAEASDVANAILDGTDAVMLSGETAAGAYPQEAVRIMAAIAEAAEEEFDHEGWPERVATVRDRPSATEAVAESAVRLANKLRAKAMITTTSSGTTPRMVSKFRPRAPILCAAWSPRTQAQLALSWGVLSLVAPLMESTDDSIGHALSAFTREKQLKSGDRVVITAGYPPGLPGNTSLILVQKVD